MAFQPLLSPLNSQISPHKPQIGFLNPYISLLRPQIRQDEQNSLGVLQDFAPFEAAALLPLTKIPHHEKPGNSYH